MDVDSHPNDASTANAFSCLVVKGLDCDVDTDPGKLPLIPGLQAPTYFAAIPEHHATLLVAGMPCTIFNPRICMCFVRQPTIVV